MTQNGIGSQYLNNGNQLGDYGSFRDQDLMDDSESDDNHQSIWILMQNYQGNLIDFVVSIWMIKITFFEPFLKFHILYKIKWLWKKVN